MNERLNPQLVNDMMRACLEGKKPYPIKNERVIVTGVVWKYALCRDTLTEIEPKIRAALAELPEEFQASRGGGWSFLNACNDKNGDQWTGDQETMEQLVCLGLGVGLVSFPYPRDSWSYLPGGVPYFRIHGA